MALTITNLHPIACIEQEAGNRGVTPEKAIDAVFAGTVVRKAIPPRQPEDIAARKEHALAILKEIHATLTDEDRAFDDNAWLYDEHGLPHRSSPPRHSWPCCSRNPAGAACKRISSRQTPFACLPPAWSNSALSR